MNIDFHVHGLLSKRKDFNSVFFMEEVNYAKQNNLDAFIMCEHYNAVNFNSIYEYLQNNFHYDENRYSINGFYIFPGVEVSIKNKGHVILAGDRLDIKEIRKKLELHMDKENRIELKDLLDMADEYDCLKIGAHPCRRGHKLCNQLDSLLQRLDGLDLNAKDIYKKGEDISKGEVFELSKRVGVNVITGSDSHTPLQLGGVITSLNRDCKTVKEIRECINTNEYSIEVLDTLNFKVFTSKILKRYLISGGVYSNETDFKL